MRPTPHSAIIFLIAVNVSNMTNLPTRSPAEVLAISPEALEVANCYLEHQNIDKVADLLDVPANEITETLDKPEVRRYIDRVFMDLGFNNRHTLRKLMDTLIETKLREMDESGIGSSKDITEILALSLKMTTELLDREIKLRELENKHQAKVLTQNNIQINDHGGSKYNSLLEKILQNGTV